MNIDQVTARLRAPYSETSSQDHNAGYEAGVSWAAETAEYSELHWLYQHAAEGAAHLCYWQVSDSPFEAYYDGQSFWDVAAGLEKASSLAFAQGFVQGALEVFRRVKDQVEA